VAEKRAETIVTAPWDSGSLTSSVPSSDLLRRFHPFGKHS